MHGRITVMSAPRKYPEEPRNRATRMAVEARRDPEESVNSFVYLMWDIDGG